MKSNRFHSTCLRAFLKGTNSTWGSVTASAPKSATTVLLIPCSDSVAQNSTKSAIVSAIYHSRRLKRRCGLAVTASAARFRGCVRSVWVRKRRRITHVESRQLTSAKGSPNNIQRAKVIVSPVSCVNRSAVTKCAPAPNSEATAESKIVVGKSRAKARLMLG